MTDRLKVLLEDAADHDQSAAEARRELRAEGVDVPAFLARVQAAADEDDAEPEEP